MLLFLSISAAVVAALWLRHGRGAPWQRALGLVAVVALSVRLLAVVTIYFIAIRTHGEVCRIKHIAEKKQSTQVPLALAHHKA